MTHAPYILFVLALAGALFFAQRVLMRRERVLLNSRDNLDPAEIYRRFYAESGLDRHAVETVWREVAKCLQVEAGRMRPSDEFGADVGRSWLTNHVLEELEQSAAFHMNGSGVKVDISKIKTVDDFVRAFAGKAS